MRVLVTGSRGFVGRNLTEELKAIRDGKDRRTRYQALLPLEVLEYDLGDGEDGLARYCGSCDFVFHLAGVNRPADGDFSYNVAGLGQVLDLLENADNRCPVMLASSAQASLAGRYAGSAYGASKLEAERLLRAHAARTGARALVYRLPNVYGKWCRPNYNSAVATFCDAIANGRPYTVSDPAVELELLYIDDLVEELLGALLGEEHREGDLCVAGPVEHATLGQITGLLQGFKAMRDTLAVPDLSEGSFEKKLCSTYLSYLEPGLLAYPLHAHTDVRGSFVEVLRTPDRGQVSVNVIKPGITKGQHWHHTKWEKFLVVSGEALIRIRRIGTDATGNPFSVDEYHVSAETPMVVEMPPGSTHSIANPSDEHDLVVLIWANECFDPEKPDTFFEEV